MTHTLDWMRNSHTPVPENWDIKSCVSLGTHTFATDEQRLTTERHTHENRSYWAAELVQNDQQNHYREWIHRIGLEETSDGVLFTIAISYATKPGALGDIKPPDAYISNLVSYVLEDATLNVYWDGIRVNNTGYFDINIIEADDLEDVLTPLIHGENTHVVVIIPDTSTESTIIAAWCRGIAEVYLINSDSNAWPETIVSELNHICPKGTAAGNWRPSPTSVTVYLPHAMQTPYFVSTSEPLDVLIDKLETTLVRLHPPFQGTVHDLASLKTVIDKDRRHDLVTKIAEQTTPTTHEQTTVEHTSHDHDSFALAETFRQDAEIANERINELETLNHQLTVKLSALQASMPQQDVSVYDPLLVSECLSKPIVTLTDALTLVEALWPNRIKVHADAYKSAKSFPNFAREDLELLLSCATALWPIYFESGSTNIERDYYKRSTFTIAMHESPMTRKQERIMKLRDHEINDTTVRCEAHIKGKSKWFLRVYVWADAINRLIHIVYAGEHLETAGSHRTNKPV